MRKIILFLITLLCLASCKTKYVTVETVHDVYHNTVDTIRDSISHEVYINQYIKGDTVFKDRVEYLYKDRWRTRDSMVIKTDSVAFPVEIVKEVQKPTPLWHYLVVCGAILVLLFNLFKKFIT